MLELNFSKYSSMAPVTWRGRCDVLAESRYAMPVSKIGKSCLTAVTSYVNVDITVLHGHGICLRRDDRGQAGHLARDQVEARAVLRTLDVHAPELAVAQEELLMRADVVEGVEVAVLGMSEAHLRALDVDPLHRLHGKLVHRGHPLPSQCATPARPRPACARARTGYGRGRRRRTPGSASAWRWTRGCRGSQGRRGARGRPGRRWRRGCSGRRCCRSRASGSRWPSPCRTGPGCGWPGRRPT